MVNFPLVLPFSSKRVEGIGATEDCLSSTLDIVVIFAAIMVYKMQTILHNVSSVNDKHAQHIKPNLFHYVG